MHRVRSQVGYLFRQVRSFVNVHPGTNRLLTGNTIAQVLLFALSPVFARVYGPRSYGLYGTYVAMYSIISVVIALKYEMSIPIAETELAAINLVMGALLTVFAMVGLTTVVGFFAGNSLLAALHFPSVQGLFWLLAISLLSNGINIVLQNWFLRHQEYSTISNYTVLQTSTQGLLQLALGLFGWHNYLGLILGLVSGQIVATVYLSLVFLREYRASLKDVSLSVMRKEAWDQRKFPFYSFPSVLINNFILELPIFILNHYGLRAVGWFTMAQRLLIQPLNFLGFAVSSTYYVEASKLILESKAAAVKMFWYTTRKMSWIGFILFGLLVLNANWIFRFVFGPSWIPSSLYVYILAIPYYFMFVSGAVGTTALATRRQDLVLVREIIRAGLYGFLFLITMYWTLTTTQTIWLLGIFSTVTYTMHFGISWLSLVRSRVQSK